MPVQKNIFHYRKLKKPVIFAHRGSSAHAPENTLAAFMLAVQQQAEAIELDAKLSTDGHVVVIHDNTVDRTTDGVGAVNSLTLDELKKLDAGSIFSHDFRSEKIPTLAEVFEAIGNQIFINVELTNYASDTDDLPDKVIKLVKKYGLEKSVLLSSFNIMALVRARSLLPLIPIGVLAPRDFAFSVLQSRILRLGPSVALHPSFHDVTFELVNTAHHAGSRVNVYTVNTRESMQQMFTAGVDGIFTDDPLMAQSVSAESIGKKP